MLLAGCGSTPTIGPTTVPATGTPAVSRPTATAFAGLPQVGALFGGPVAGGTHYCTASVVHSPRHDLLVTAGHCLSGTGSTLVFAPGYHDGDAPYGSWTVVATYVSAAWSARHDPQADVAFLTVAPQQRSGRVVNVEDVVGADRLVVSRGFHVRATVVGYPLGSGGRPLTCTNETYDEGGYPAFGCDGYVDGTSGGPWLTGVDPATRRGDLYGLIGGLHQGGCTPQISYSSYFGPDVQALYARAIRGGPGDDVPAAGSDGC